MTREEAIKAISDMILDMEYPNGVYHEKFTEDESQKHLALYAVKKALRPVSREQVEKVPRCEHCKDGKSFDGQVVIMGNKGMFPLNFCPRCGSPLTDEAVEMVMKRMEVLNDAD